MSRVNIHRYIGVRFSKKIQLSRCSLVLFLLNRSLFNRRVGILFERNHWMRMRRVWHDISVVLSTRERERERSVWKAYRKLVGDFPHDSSMNVEPSIVGWKNDEKFSTEFLWQASRRSLSTASRRQFWRILWHQDLPSCYFRYVCRASWSKKADCNSARTI